MDFDHCAKCYFGILERLVCRGLSLICLSFHVDIGAMDSGPAKTIASGYLRSVELPLLQSPYAVEVSIFTKALSLES